MKVKRYTVGGDGITYEDLDGNYVLHMDVQRLNEFNKAIEEERDSWKDAYTELLDEVYEPVTDMTRLDFLQRMAGNYLIVQALIYMAPNYDVRKAIDDAMSKDEDELKMLNKVIKDKTNED